jgi:hypothetical protein
MYVLKMLALKVRIFSSHLTNICTRMWCPLEPNFIVTRRHSAISSMIQLIFSKLRHCFVFRCCFFSFFFTCRGVIKIHSLASNFNFWPCAWSSKWRRYSQLSDIHCSQKRSIICIIQNVMVIFMYFHSFLSQTKYFKTLLVWEIISAEN